MNVTLQTRIVRSANRSYWMGSGSGAGRLTLIELYQCVSPVIAARATGIRTHPDN